jgi:hypothetical protein
VQRFVSTRSNKDKAAAYCFLAARFTFLEDMLITGDQARTKMEKLKKQYYEIKAALGKTGNGDSNDEDEDGPILPGYWEELNTGFSARTGYNAGNLSESVPRVPKRRDLEDADAETGDGKEDEGPTPPVTPTNPKKQRKESGLVAVASMFGQGLEKIASALQAPASPHDKHDELAKRIEDSNQTVVAVIERSNRELLQSFESGLKALVNAINNKSAN